MIPIAWNCFEHPHHWSVLYTIQWTPSGLQKIIYCCQILLIKFIEDLNSALDKDYKIGTVFMDLTKAFYCVSHGLLVATPHVYRLSEASCEKTFDYMQNHKQRVKISNSRSDWKQEFHEGSWATSSISWWQGAWIEIYQHRVQHSKAPY